VAKKAKAPKFRSRIKEFIPSCPTEKLIQHPDNWRLHPEQQKQVLGSLLDRHGKVDAILAYESAKYGGLVIIDGHQRQEMDDAYPVLILDVDDAEAAEILMTYNPLAAMSDTDTDSYRRLLAAIEQDEADNAAALSILAESVLGESIIVSQEQEDVTLKRVEVRAPPKMAWIVIGCPLVEFGGATAILDQLQIIEGVIVESTTSDWTPKK